MEEQKAKFKSIRSTDHSFYLKWNSKYKKVPFTIISDTVDKSDLLRRELPERWRVPTPEAVIAITGINHQFNIKDKRNLKKKMIEAVISTGSWIVTCGTESGVVNFIEEAVNEHSTLEKYNIPIVGLMSERVLKEAKPHERPVDVKKIIDGEVKSVKIPRKSTMEKLDPTHTQFIVLKDSSKKNINRSASSECREVFESFLYNIKDSDFKNAHYVTNEILPVVLVLIEGGIDALETVWSVLKNNNPVVVINGSGGAANFLATCYQRFTSLNRKSDSEQANLIDYVENLHELIRKCFEDKSDEIKIKAKKLATRCLKKHELIRVYSLDEKSTKLDDLIQNAIFDIYKEYFYTEDDHQKECASGNTPKLNAVKKQLELVAKWKNYDIAKNEIFIAENRNQLTCLQELNEKKMYKLKNEIRKVITAVHEEYARLPVLYDRFKKNVSKFQVATKARCQTVLSKSFTELIEHLHDLSFVDRKDLIEEFEEIVQDFIDTHHMKRINEFQNKIKGRVIKENQTNERFSKKLSESYTEFKKDILQFCWVRKTGYFSLLSRSFYKLVKPLPADDRDELTHEFRSISETFVKMHTFDEKSMDKLDKKIKGKVMAKRKYFSNFDLDLDEYYNQYKDRLSHFVEINREDYFMDQNMPNFFNTINKATYFTNMTKSFENMLKNIKDDSFLKHEDDLRRIQQEFVDEKKKDSVSQLFQSSLLANKTDLVMLVMQKIESMSSFVLDNLPDVFRLSIDIKDCSAIQLIQQHWDLHIEKNVESDMTGKLQSELGKKSDKACKFEIKKKKQNNGVLLAVNNFIIDLFANTEFKLYEVKGEEKKELEFIYKDKPFHHLFVWAVLVNWREMAMIFWEQETDLTCSALFASAVLKELSAKAHFSKHMHLSKSLKENSRHFENLACNVMTELYSNERENALQTLVTRVGRYNSTPLEIAVSQRLEKFIAHTACQAKLNSIWNGDIVEYTPFWRVSMVTFLPILLIQRIGFITFKTEEKTSQQISPGQYRNEDQYQHRYADPAQNQNADPGQNRDEDHKRIPEPNETKSNFVYRFYNAPVTKFVVYMITYMAFVVMFAIFVLTDLYPLSENPPSILEYLTWLWTLSLAIEEIRQILQTNKGSLSKNVKYWAKDVWNIFDIVMYYMFLFSVVLRCLLNSEQFYFARMAYAITLSMFILRSMHFFFVQRYIGPKVVMIGRMLGDLGFFIALYALFLLSFGIMYQAVLFPNSKSPPLELLRDLVYLPYWQLYGELNLGQIEGEEPSKCTNDPQLYTNGTMQRCPIKNQLNALMPAVYLILTNILLVNIIIAIFSQTFQTVQDNSELIWKFHMYALVYEYYDRPMFPIPIVIHLGRIIGLCYNSIQIKKKNGGAFVFDAKPKEIERLHVNEKNAYESFQNGPDYVRSRYDAMNMMTDERDINKEIDSTPTQHDIKELREEIYRLRESLIQEIRS